MTNLYLYAEFTIIMLINDPVHASMALNFTFKMLF